MSNRWWRIGAIGVLAVLVIWAAFKFLWFWAFLAAVGVIYLMATDKSGPGNDGVGE